MRHFKPRSGLASIFKKKNPILERRELVVECPDTGVGTGKIKMKMGDGTTPYNDLPYAIGDHECEGSIDIPITLTAENWVEEESGFSQLISVLDLRTGMTPIVLFTSDAEDARLAISSIVKYEVTDGSITFYSTDNLSVDISLVLKGIPAQKIPSVDNTIIFFVDPSAFSLNEEIGRYEATIQVNGMTDGIGGTWDIVRSGPTLSEAESKIALSITDVDRMNGVVKITCLEVPEQRYMMSITGAYPNVDPGSIILSGMEEWIDKVNNLEKNSGKTNFPFFVDPVGVNIVFDLGGWNDRVAWLIAGSIAGGKVLSMYGGSNIQDTLTPITGHDIIREYTDKKETIQANCHLGDKSLLRIKINAAEGVGNRICVIPLCNAKLIQQWND